MVCRHLNMPHAVFYSIHSKLPGSGKLFLSEAWRHEISAGFVFPIRESSLVSAGFSLVGGKPGNKKEAPGPLSIQVKAIGFYT